MIEPGRGGRISPASTRQNRQRLVARLLRSREPSVRLSTRLGVLLDHPEGRSIARLRDEVRYARRTRSLIRIRNRPGRRTPPGIYYKWLGDHWVLAHLAEMGYPPGDEALRPRLERALSFWLRPTYFQEFEAANPREARERHDAVPRMNGRYRRCASQQGNALLYGTLLGFAQGECDRLAERLIHWQWPDGGWNCDVDPDADTSSFGETLSPMRGLTVYGKIRRVPGALQAARRASEVFLRRSLYRRATDGSVIHPDFIRLHYPLYWHYDILGALTALASLRKPLDPRCSEALDLVESMELPRGGWAATGRFFDRPGERPRRGQDWVRWDAPTQGGMNEWISVRALTALVAGGRFVATPGSL